MIPDGELLRRYTATNSESAFTELVERHLALVYSAALRQVNGDAHLAQDVAQTVFAELARKAAALAHRPVLTGWLYTTAHFAAVKAVRTERRRHTHEEEAQLMNQLLADPAPDLDWEKLRPVLDAAMLELNETDREAVLLRYFDNRPHADIADRLGLSENAARMKVERALEKLHSLLGRRGVSTTAALSAVILANAVQVAPAGLAAALSTAALAGTTLATIATHTTMNWINIKSISAIIAAAIAAGTGTHLVQQRESGRLRSENENLTLQQEKLTSERNAALSSANNNTDELDRLRKEKNELLRLRGEVGILRAQKLELEKLRKVASHLDTARALNSPSATAALEFPRTSWAFAGSATPEAACQSSFWALSTGDTNAVLNLMTPEEKVVIQDNLAQFSMLLSNAPAAFSDTKGFSILSKQVVSDDEVILDVRLDGSNTNSFQKTTMKRYGSEWKILTTTVHEE